MKISFSYDHRNAIAEWTKRESHEWLEDVFEAPALKIKGGCTTAIRSHVQAECQAAGWATGVKINQDLGLTIFAMKKDAAMQLQMGNVSRAPYDLLKLQHLWQTGRIETAALALPTKAAAEIIGSNIANAERMCNELKVFDRIITCPIVIVAFE